MVVLVLPATAGSFNVVCATPCVVATGLLRILLLAESTETLDVALDKVVLKFLQVAAHVPCLARGLHELVALCVRTTVVYALVMSAALSRVCYVVTVLTLYISFCLFLALVSTMRPLFLKIARKIRSSTR